MMGLADCDGDGDKMMGIVQVLMMVRVQGVIRDGDGVRL